LKSDRKPRGGKSHAEPDPGSCAQLSLLDLADPARDESLMDPADFADALARMTSEPIKVILTKNSSTLISAKQGKDGVREARIQEAFRGADPKTMYALARFIVRPDRRSREAIDNYIRDRADLFQALGRDPAPARTSSRGRRRNLKKIMAKVLGDYGLKIKDLTIGWGKRASATRGKRSIKFGSYCHQTRTITIHPELDREDVPDYFVEYIVYHEALHAVFPPERGDDGRREVHGAEFKRFEKKFREYAEARKFEKYYVRRLLGTR